MRFNIFCVCGKVKGVLCSLPSLRYRPPSRREEMEETEIKKTGTEGRIGLPQRKYINFYSSPLLRNNFLPSKIFFLPFHFFSWIFLLYCYARAIFGFQQRIFLTSFSYKVYIKVHEIKLKLLILFECCCGIISSATWCFRSMYYLALSLTSRCTTSIQFPTFQSSVLPTSSGCSSIERDCFSLIYRKYTYPKRR